MKIIDNKEAVCGIILPENPTPREKFAAEELIFYFEKMSGVKLEITDKHKNKIIIGDPSRNSFAKNLLSESEFDENVPGPEGFIILAEGNTLLLAGSSKNQGEKERGTLYAVYELLERYLGCSLSAYSHPDADAGEFVPCLDNIEIPDTKYIKSSADVSYRAGIVEYSDSAGNPEHGLNVPFISWLAKNRYNRIVTWESIYEAYKENGMLDEIIKRGINLTVGHHQSIELFMPHYGNKYFSEKYYETHPEYYKLMEDGTRFGWNPDKPDYTGQFVLCAKNQACIRTFAENIIAWLDKNPYVDIVNVWPNDGMADGCKCAECSRFTKVQNYTYFVDEVSKIVAKAKPHVKIDQCAYVDLSICETDRISSSVIIECATWFKDGLRKVGKPDGTCLNGTIYEDAILEWKNAGAKVAYYDYFMGIFASVQKWMPMADEMQAICRRFVEKGILGLGTQIEPFNMWNNIVNFLCFGRTAYDTNLSLSDNLDIFTRIFGNAAPVIKEIVLYGEEVLDGNEIIYRSGEYLIKNIDRQRVYALYEKALKMAETKRAKNNVKLMRMVFRYSDLEVNNEKHDNEAIKITKAKDPTGELTYLYDNYDSFNEGKGNVTGYGISIPLAIRSDVMFEPDYWSVIE